MVSDDPSDVKPTLAVADFVSGARLLAALPALLWRPVHPDQARRIVQGRVERRARDFLDVVRRVIFNRPHSPYLRLLNAAGCEAGDLDRLIAREGLEETLAVLFRAGVYLTVDELKGRRPVVRGSASFRVEPRELSSPLSRAHLVRHTSGSGGPSAAVAVDLRHVRDCAVDTCLAFEARGSAGWRHAVWTVPGASAIVQMVGNSPSSRRRRPMYSGERRINGRSYFHVSLRVKAASAWRHSATAAAGAAPSVRQVAM